MEKAQLPLDLFKEELMQDIDFIIGERKELNKEDKLRLVRLINAKITIYSHENGLYKRKDIDHYVQHSMRESERERLKEFVKKYLSNKKIKFI